MDVRGLMDRLDAVDVDSIGVNVDQKALDEIREKLMMVSRRVAEKIHYPKTFSGMAAENVYEFIANIQQAMINDKIRTRNKKNVLINYLTGDAEIAVKHAGNVDDAFNTLQATFGIPLMIWKRRKLELQSSLGKNEWRPYKSVERRNALSRLSDFIAGAKALADQHESLKREVLSDSTIRFVYNLLPYNILKDIVVKIEWNPSMDGVVLNSIKTTNANGMATSGKFNVLL